jgi:serine/threonine protein kinase
METMSVSLHDVIHDPNCPIKLTPREEVHVILTVAKAIQVLHTVYNTVHRDIKPKNVLLSRTSRNTLHVKLADFGISMEVVVNTNLETKLLRGTTQYLPKEFFQEKLVSHAMDVYALACLIFEVIYKETPWSGLGPEQIRFHVVEEDKVPTCNKKVHKCWNQMIKIMQIGLAPINARWPLDTMIRTLELVDITEFPSVPILSYKEICQRVTPSDQMRMCCQALIEEKPYNGNAQIIVFSSAVNNKDMWALTRSLLPNDLVHTLHFKRISPS